LLARVQALKNPESPGPLLIVYHAGECGVALARMDPPARTRSGVGPVGPRSRAHAKARSREVSDEMEQFFAACWPGRPGLQRCRSGGRDCLVSTRSRWSRSPAGRIFRGWIIGDNGELWLLADNYNQAATGQTTKRTKLTKDAQRPTWRFLRGHRQPRPVSPLPRIGAAHRSSLLAVQTIELPKA
ncbi:MAG: hypothetical protein PHN61_04940, partial [Methanothrix sp.]|nr:hypothetical protein [Methanothrix sp.]